MAQEPDIDLGAVTEALNNKTDTDGGNVQTTFGMGIFNNDAAIPVIETGTSGNDGTGRWYRLYADGWLVQGGLQQGTGSYGVANVSFMKEFNSTPGVMASVILSGDWDFTATSTVQPRMATDYAGSISDRTTTGFKTQSMSGHDWIAWGWNKTT